MSYTGNNPKDVSVTEPTENVSSVAELNDADRQLRRAVIYGHDAVVSKTGNYTLTDTDHFVDFNATTPVATLPQVSAVSSTSIGRKYIIRNSHATSPVTVTPFSGDTCPVASVLAGETVELIALGGTAWKTLGTNLLRSKVINIGNWNMYIAGGGVNSKTIAHGLADESKFRGCLVTIRNDTNTIQHTLPKISAGDIHAWFRDVLAGNIVIDSLISGYFDDGQYGSASFNRGYVTIWYVE